MIVSDKLPEVIKAGFSEAEKIMSAQAQPRVDYSNDIYMDGNSDCDSVMQLKEEDEMDLREKQYSFCVDIISAFEAATKEDSKFFFVDLFVHHVILPRKEVHFGEFFVEN
jgi:hypothetical protein